MKRNIQIILKIIGRILLSICCLFVALYFILQLPAVQNYCKQQLTNYVSQKVGTQFDIKRLRLHFFNELALEGLYCADLRKDTLLYAHQLNVKFDLFALLERRLHIKGIALQGSRIHVYRENPDTTFNYQFIVDAFASKDTVALKPSADAAPFLLNIHNIALENVHCQFKDDVAGIDVKVNVGSFETGLPQLNLDKLSIQLGAIQWKNTQVWVRRYAPLLAVSPPEDTSATSLSIMLPSVDAQHITLDYADAVSSMQVAVQVPKLHLDIDSIDVGKNYYKVSKLALHQLQTKLRLGKASKQLPLQSNQAVATAFSWRLVLGMLELKNATIAYDDDAMPRAKQGLDYSHLELTGINTTLQHLDFSENHFKGHIQQLALKERSGLNIKNLHTHFFVTDKKASLGNLLLTTPKTEIKDSIFIRYPSWSAFANNLSGVYVQAFLRKTKVAVSDVLLFAPALKPQLAAYENSVCLLHTLVSGYVDNLHVHSFELSGVGNTALAASARLKGLPSMDKFSFDVQLQYLKTTQQDIVRFLPKGFMASQTFRLPHTIVAKGSAWGNLYSLRASVAVQTSSGAVVLHADIDKVGRFDITANVKNLELGYLLHQESMLGTVSLETKVKGTGLRLNNFQIDQLTATYTTTIESATINNYAYRNVQLEGHWANKILHTHTSIADDNVRLQLKGAVDMLGATPRAYVHFSIDSLKLEQLGWASSRCHLSLQGRADFDNLHPDALSGHLSVNKIFVQTDSAQIALDNLQFVAMQKDSIHSISIQADSSLLLQLEGKYTLTSLANAVLASAHHYYQIPNYTPQNYMPQQLALQGFVNFPALLQNKFPLLKGSGVLHFEGNYSSENHTLRLTAMANSLAFSGNKVENLRVDVHTVGDSLQVSGDIDAVHISEIALHKTHVRATVANSSAIFSLQLKDKKQQPWYDLKGQFYVDKDYGYKVSLDPSQLLLNYNLWHIAPDNFISYDTAKGIIAHHFDINYQNQHLALNSNTHEKNAPLSVTFKQFQIATLIDMANISNVEVDGVINGSAELRDVLTSKPLFVSNITIDHIVYQKDTICNLQLNVDNRMAPDIYTADIALLGYGNDIALTGNYYTQNGTIDLNLLLHKIALSRMKSFAKEHLLDLGGMAKGALQIKGTMQAPKIDGHVVFDSTFLVPYMTGEKISFHNQFIHFGEKGFSLKQFKILDSKQNTITFNGDIFTKDFKSYTFDMGITARNFNAVNAELATKRFFFGQLNVDTDMTLTGSVDAPFLRGNIRINEDTDFSLMMPSDDPEIEERKGVVVFASQKEQKMQTVNDDFHIKDSMPNPSTIKGMDIFLSIETDTSAQLAMVMDPRSGDAISLQGLANIDFGIDRSGRVNMTGNYILTHGYYSLSFALIHKKFEILPGSTIVWTGDPFTANIDIQANLPVTASAMDLITQEYGGNIDLKYNQYLPFNVILNLQNELMKPDITFDIAFKDDRQKSQYPLIDTKLQQIRNNTSEMNKQVFALILLGNFVGPNPFESSGKSSTSIANMAKQSVSKLLTQEVNKLASGLVKEVDLNFNFNADTDYSTGKAIDRADVSVGISKRLLDDKLRVSIGSSFALGGTAAKQTAANIAGDIAIDYKLTDDGKYLLRGYRKNLYEGVIEGQVVRTGVGFAMTVEYNKFKEMFIWNNKKRVYKKEQKKKKKEQQQNTAAVLKHEE